MSAELSCKTKRVEKSEAEIAELERKRRRFCFKTYGRTQRCSVFILAYMKMSISLMRFWFFLEIVSNNCLISHMENLITVVETAWDVVEKESFLWRMSCY